MRVKLTLMRGGGRPAADLLVTFDAAATVGGLAEFLTLSDPAGSSARPHPSTLSIVGSGHGIAPRTALVESGMRSGSTVRLEDATDDAAGAPLIPAAVVRVLSGPDRELEFPVPSGTSVIGRDPSCTVRLTDPLVSRQHARLHVTDVAEIVDLGSANGLLLGDDPADRAILRPGDTVRLGDTVLAVTVLAAAGRDGDLSMTIGFNRPPRIDPRYEGAEFQAPEPPDPPRSQRFPIIPLFAPLILGLVIYLSTHALTSLLFVALSPVMMIANVAEGRWSGRKSYNDALALFRSDIQDLVGDVTNAANDERARRRAEHPSTAECAVAAKSLTPELWSRAPDLPGFLELRLGIGRQPSRSTIALPQGKQNNRALWRELRQAIAPFAVIDEVPVVAQLTSEGAVGIAGPPELAVSTARALLLQLACLHSPSDVVIAVCASGQTAALWDWAKWLPHCSPTTTPLTVSPLASTLGACDALVADLERLIEQRMTRADGDNSASAPAIAVLLEDEAPVDRSRVVALVERGGTTGIHVIWVASAVSRLPAVCKTFVEVAPTAEAATAGFVTAGNLVMPMEIEQVSAELAAETARWLSPVVDTAANDAGDTNLPQSVSFLSLTGRELATSADAVIERWTESRSLLSGPYAHSGGARRVGSLRALLGQSAAGPVVLDLRTHGPHALVGGTTGSGKSELLQTWILGMASAYAPTRVTFLLVDYKGGSAFSECIRLPHTVGLVTDLSPQLVRRALRSLSAELRYRERILHAKGAKDLLELELSGDPEAPPSLVIVVDEFAALVQEMPEFVDGVVNVAQRGRSLGLHLILATQRPAGVIKDNLRANTNLRLALRMADEADSSDVLGSPMAASFDPRVPGRAVSRTGPSQLMPFQAAYVGGWTKAQQHDSVQAEAFGFGPSQAWEATAPAVSSDDLGPTDIQRIVGTIRAAFEKAQVPAPRLPWLSELAAAYDLAALPSPRRDDALVFGVVDDPDQQIQPTVAFNPDRDGNLAVFGTGGSGKSTLLRTLAIAAGFTVRSGPCHVYGIDFGARGLSMLDQLPNVGSIVAGSDHERISRLLTMLRELIEERAARYSRAGAGTITDYRRLSGQVDEPRILLLIDGVGAFRTAYEGTEYNRWFDLFLGIAADGRPVGIHVLLSADRPGALPTALGSLVQRRLLLRLADAGDYAMLGAPSDVLDAKSPPGRGLIGESEVQIATLGGTSDVLEQARAIQLFTASMRQAGGATAPPIQRLADRIPIVDLPDTVGGLPVIGVAGATLAPIGFEPRGTFLIAGPPGSGRTTALIAAAQSLRRWRASARLFYVGSARSPLAALSVWQHVAVTDAEITELASTLPATLGESTPTSAPCAVLIEGIPELVGGPADFALQEMIKKLVTAGHLVIAEGETSALSASYPLLVAMRAGRNGIVLQPDQLDGNLLRVQFPRLRKADFPAGRCLFVSRGSQPTVVQLALPQSVGEGPAS